MTEVYEFRHRHAHAGTAETDAHTPQPATQIGQPPSDRLESPRDLAKFTGLVALFALFRPPSLALLAVRRETQVS